MNMKKKGFTTIELIAVVAAIVVLAAILIPSFAVLNKRIKEQAAMQEQINQQLGEIADKVENQDYMSKAEFEAKLAEELAKINAQLKADAENKNALIAEIQAKVDAAIETLNSMEKALTKEQVEEIIAKALEGQLTLSQVKAIVQEALKDVVSEEDIKKIVEEAIEALRKEIGESQITTEQMEKAINEAIAKALEGTNKDIEGLKAQIAEIIAKLNNGLTKEEVEKIIEEALKKFEENQKPAVTPEEMKAAINEAVEKALAEQAKDMEALRAELQAIAEKLNSSLTKEEVEKIIADALEAFKESLGQGGQTPDQPDQPEIPEGEKTQYICWNNYMTNVVGKEGYANCDYLAELTQAEWEELGKWGSTNYAACPLCGEMIFAYNGEDTPEVPDQPEIPEIETKHYMCWNNYMHNVQGNNKYEDCKYEADLTEAQVQMLGGKCPRCGESIYQINNPDYVPEEETPVHYICWNNYMHNVQGNNKYEDCEFEADLTQSQIDLLGKWGSTDHPKCPRCGEMLIEYDNPDYVKPEEKAEHYACWNNIMHNYYGNDKYYNCTFEADLTQSDLDFYGKWNNTDNPMCPVCGEALYKFNGNKPEQPEDPVEETVLCICFAGHEHYVTKAELEAAQAGSGLITCKTEGCFEPMKPADEYEEPEKPEQPENTVANLEQLKDALTNSDASNIKLSANIVLDEAFTIDRDVTIDLNGNKLTTVANVVYPTPSTLYVQKGYSLTITNGEIVDVATKLNGGFNFIYVAEGAELNLENVEVTLSISPDVYWNDTMDRWQSNSAEHRIFTIGNNASVVLKNSNITINITEVLNMKSYVRNPFTVVAVYFVRNSQNSEFVIDGGSFTIQITDPAANAKTDTIYFVKADRRTDVAAHATNTVAIKGDANVTIGGLTKAGELNSTNELCYLGDGYNKGYTYYSGISFFRVAGTATLNIDGLAYNLKGKECVWSVENLCQDFGLRSKDKEFYNITEIVYSFACTACDHEAEFTLAELEEHVNYWGTKKVNGVVLPKCDHCSQGGLELQ